jgi:hypothetical protein
MKRISFVRYDGDDDDDDDDDDDGDDNKNNDIFRKQYQRVVK